MVRAAPIRNPVSRPNPGDGIDWLKFCVLDWIRRGLGSRSRPRYCASFTTFQLLRVALEVPRLSGLPSGRNSTLGQNETVNHLNGKLAMHRDNALADRRAGSRRRLQSPIARARLRNVWRLEPLRMPISIALLRRLLRPNLQHKKDGALTRSVGLLPKYEPCA